MAINMTYEELRSMALKELQEAYVKVSVAPMNSVGISDEKVIVGTGVLEIGVSMDWLYQQYLGNGYDNMIAQLYELIENMQPMQLSTIMYDLFDYQNYIKAHLAERLIPVKGNEEYLSNKVCKHIPGMEDIVALYEVRISNDMVITVSNTLLERWGINQTTLDQDTIKNRISYGYYLRPLQELLKPLTSDEDILYSMMEAELETDPDILYILSSKDAFHGAAAVLDDKFLLEFAAMKDLQQVIIIPSSQNEVLLVDTSIVDVDLVELRCLVMESNVSNVSPMDKLSDSIYIYDVQSRSISRFGEDIAETKQVEQTAQIKR